LSVHHTGFGKQRYRAGFKKSGLKLKLWYDVFKMLIHVNYQIDGIYLFRRMDGSASQATSSP
jgi:hypothetical protein